LAYGGLYAILNGREPFSLRNKEKDSQQTKTAEKFKVISYLILSQYNIQNTIEN